LQQSASERNPRRILANLIVAAAVQLPLNHLPEKKKSVFLGSCHKRRKPQAPTPQAPIRNRQTRKVTNAKGLNRNTNLT